MAEIAATVVAAAAAETKVAAEVEAEVATKVAVSGSCLCFTQYLVIKVL